MRRVGVLSRRRLLATVSIGVAAGASGCAVIRPGAAVPAVTADPLEELVKEKQALYDQYVAVIAAHPALAHRLGPLRDAHQQHRDALLDLIDARRRRALANATPPVPEPSDASPSADGSVGSDRAAAVALLRNNEKTAAASTRTACLQLTDPPANDAGAGLAERLAVLGSMAAAEASHQVALA
jgi:hypothetical protein